jgi:hypothetical protein
MQICRHRKTFANRETFEIFFFELSWVERVCADDFRWVICFYLENFQSFCLDLVTYCRWMFKDPKHRRFGNCREEFVSDRNTIAFVNRQVLIWANWFSLFASLFRFRWFFLSVWSFACSNSDNLQENFRLANRCTTRTPTVIRLTALPANISRLKVTTIYFCSSLKFANNFDVIVSFELVIWYFRRAEKCVHSPSIHHAISRQKLSINQSNPSIKRRERDAK